MVVVAVVVVVVVVAAVVVVAVAVVVVAVAVVVVAVVAVAVVVAVADVSNQAFILISLRSCCSLPLLITAKKSLNCFAVEKKQQ